MVGRYRTLLIPGTAAVLAYAACRRLRRLVVVGRSMQPTLEPGDRVVLLKSRRARPGDLVVVPDPRDGGRLVVKRAVGVSDGGIVVRGDNPEASTDSRVFGPVPASSVRGRVVYRYHPPHTRGFVGREVP